MKYIDMITKPSEESLSQSRVYVNLDYIFKVIQIVCQYRVYVNLFKVFKIVCQSRAYVNLDYISGVYTI